MAGIATGKEMTQNYFCHLKLRGYWYDLTNHDKWRKPECHIQTNEFARGHSKYPYGHFAPDGSENTIVSCPETIM